MATTSNDTMENVERRRAQLEENVAKLRKSLEQWQTWEMEYEILKEEIGSLPSPSPSAIIEAGKELRLALVNAKEIQELVGKDKTTRNANQVIDMISRRVDYVQQNIKSTEKLLDTAEKKLDASEVLLGQDLDNEEGLPLMDIQEELDEEGNVISSEVVQPGKSTPAIVEALRKAGVDKLEREMADSPKVSEGESSNTSSATSTNGTTESTGNTLITASAEPDFDFDPTMPVPAPAKKAVTFADEPESILKTPSSESASPKKTVKFADEAEQDPVAKSKAALETHGYNEDLANYNFTKGTKVFEVDEDDTPIVSYPIIPQGESPEDAALRRQMLQYGLSEVGNIVAEIDLDEPVVQYSDEDWDEDEEYDEDDSYVSEDEDEHGRSLRPVVTDDYRKQMLDLEKKLNARMVENIGPRPDDETRAELAEDIRILKIRKDDAFEKPADVAENAPADSAPKKKGVRFADELDVSPPPQPVKAASPPMEPTAPPKPTMSDTIVERTAPAPQPPTMGPSKPAKVSRFKSSRPPAGQNIVNTLPAVHAPEPQPVPSGPKDRTLANTIVEKDELSSEPHIPDEFDPAIISREVQTQYHKMRNKMIQQQGGFKPSAEEQDYPLMEEVDGKTKKVSRFRAARLKEEGSV